jgi:hypothetical protein
MWSGDAVIAMDQPANSLIHYDAEQRRLWLAGQRCHHGAAGGLLTAVAAAGLVAARLRVRGLATLALTGSVLMAHDWKDRSLWFSRGWQDQPWHPRRP